MPGAPRGRGRGFGPPFAPGRGWSGSRVPGRPDSVREGPRDRPPPEPRARPRVAAWGLANGSGGAPQWKPPPEAEDPNQQPLGARLGSGPHTPREAPTSAPVSCHIAYAYMRPSIVFACCAIFRLIRHARWHQVDAAVAAPPQRPRLMSMVVVGGTKRTAQQSVRLHTTLAALTPDTLTSILWHSARRSTLPCYRMPRR